MGATRMCDCQRSEYFHQAVHLSAALRVRAVYEHMGGSRVAPRLLRALRLLRVLVHARMAARLTQGHPQGGRSCSSQAARRVVAMRQQRATVCSKQ